MMTNEKLVLSIVPADNLTAYNCALEVARRKDEEYKILLDTQPISELGGWHTEPPTEDGLYLADKGYADEDAFRYIVVWWSCRHKMFSLPSKMFYQEIKRWKRI